MDATLVSASYQPSLLSIPPGVALGVLLVVIAYSSVVRGAAELRGWFLIHSIALLPYAVASTLAPSLVDPELVTLWFRIAAALVPLSATAGIAFLQTLLGQPARTRQHVAAMASLVLAAPCLATPWIIGGVSKIQLDVWFVRPGPLAPLWLLVTAAIALSSLVPLVRAALASGEGMVRRQLRRISISSAITTAALSDFAVAYLEGLFPIGWLLLGIGSALTLRALVLDDLLRVRAIDTRAPLFVLHLAGAVLLGWAVLELLEGGVPWWAQTVGLVGAFGSVRVAVVLTWLILRGARVARGRREDMLAQFAESLHTLETQRQISDETRWAVDRLLKAPASLLLPSTQDYGWSRDGERLEDAAAPDPRLRSWFATAASVASEEVDRLVPAAHAEALRRLFHEHEARVLVPLRSRDELLGLLLVGGPRPLRAPSRNLLQRVGERVSDALSHLQVLQRVHERTAILRDVELAAMLQTTYLPAEQAYDFGRVRIAGLWRAATQCGGDLWAVYELGAGRALVVVGDVTGHGVSPAMVTAAVRSACDVAVRASGAQIALPSLLECLDAAVHRVGADRLHMSCLVAIVDATAGEVSFLNAGHAAPYVVRGDGELEAMVAHGPALGSGQPMPTTIGRKAVRPGDLVVWYTDGVTDAQSRTREPFGHRELQRRLRRVRADASPDEIAKQLLAAVTSHRGEATFDDDVTVVVARIRAPDAPLATHGETEARAPTR